MVRKVERVKQGDLLGVRSEFKPKAEEPFRAGVRASILAEKRSNVRGVKGRRKEDARS